MHDRLRRNLTPANVQLLLHAFPCLDKILVFAGKSGANAAQDTPLRFAEAVAWLLAVRSHTASALTLYEGHCVPIEAANSRARRHAVGRRQLLSPLAGHPRMHRSPHMPVARL